MTLATLMFGAVPPGAGVVGFGLLGPGVVGFGLLPVGQAGSEEPGFTDTADQAAFTVAHSRLLFGYSWIADCTECSRAWA
ncbi:MAG TPA: hypothetical protein VNV66_07385, partial [Pilimelia sp.]|nr:hypothetical protein [Pilimelia sp.]